MLAIFSSLGPTSPFVQLQTYTGLGYGRPAPILCRLCMARFSSHVTSEMIGILARSNSVSRCSEDC